MKRGLYLNPCLQWRLFVGLLHLTYNCPIRYMWWRWLCASVCLLVLVSAADQTRPEYTEDLEKFKSDKQKARLQMLVGCWLMSREYMPAGTDDQKLALVKVCMKHITRKDSVVKITSLIGKNMTETKSYQEVVPAGDLPQQGQPLAAGASELDGYLLGLLKNYERDLVNVNHGEGEEIKRRVEEEVEKRTKYYFGIIPANQWTHLIMLISISLILVMLCTCWKYFQMRKMKEESKKHAKDDYFKQSAGFTKDHKCSPKKNK